MDKHTTRTKFIQRFSLLLFVMIFSCFGSIIFQVSVLNAQKAQTGIKLSGFKSASPPAKWSVLSTTDEKVAEVQNQWGFVSIPPGHYKIRLVPQGYRAREITWKIVKVQKDEVTIVEIDSGIQLDGRTAEDAPPASWTVHNLNTDEPIAYVHRRWGFTPLPVGDYEIRLLPEGYKAKEIVWKTAKVHKNEVTIIEIDSGIQLGGRSEEDSPPASWTVHNLNTDEPIAYVHRRWAFTPLPAGDYEIRLLPEGYKAEMITWGSVGVGPGRVVRVDVDSGIQLSGRSPEEETLANWIVMNAETNEPVSYVHKRWGFTPLTPGKYILKILPQGYQSLELIWTQFIIQKHQVADIKINSGIEIISPEIKDLKPEVWEVYDLSGGELAARVRNRSGFTPLQPGQYIVETQVAGFKSLQPIVVESNRTTKLSWDDLGLQHLTEDRPYAPIMNESNLPEGINLALAVLGSNITATSQSSDAWAAKNLVDGIYFIPGSRGGCDVCGWASKDRTFPQEIVFSFHRDRPAKIHGLVFDTTTFETASNRSLSCVPKDVEVWTAPDTNGTFSRIAAVRLRQKAALHLIDLPPSKARFVKVRILSNHGGGTTQAGEILILESSDEESIVADLPKNLALPALGGCVVWFTSSAQYYPVGQLIDGYTGLDGRDWRSKDSYLPQDIVFSFRGDQTAFVDHITILSDTKSDPATRPKKISIAVSQDHPMKNFREVGQFSLEQETDEQSFRIGELARFVRFRIIENFGGNYTSLAEVKIFEGSTPGYDSVLLRDIGVSGSEAQTVAGPLPSPKDIDTEQEPNNTNEQANSLRLGRWMKGQIEPLGEKDFFHLKLLSRTKSVLTVDLLGIPNIRTSVKLFDSNGGILKDFDAGLTPEARKSFSWILEPAEYMFQLTEPPVKIVLIWDTSGSMTGSTEDLKESITTFINQLRPGDQLNLIRFSNRTEEDQPVEVLLSDFTDDRESLLHAIEDKVFAEGGTPFYDAVAEGMKLLEGVSGNRAIVVMTDGADTASKNLNHFKFWNLMKEGQIRLYAVGLGRDLITYNIGIGNIGRRFLKQASEAAGGRFFYALESEELLDRYREISDDLRSKATYYLRPQVAQGLGTLKVLLSEVQPPGEISKPKQIELILDASGSMREKKRKIDGRLKIDIAKEVLSQFIQELPDDSRVALRVYGHRIREGQAGDCRDTELLVPFGLLDRNFLLQKINSIGALGTTPLAYSLSKVAEDFGNFEGQKTVILVSDGKEECGGDPFSVVKELQEKGLDVVLKIVGFALAEPEVKKEMKRVAELTGGQFFVAEDKESLNKALQQALSASYIIQDLAGTMVASGATGQSLRVPAGVYEIIIDATEREIRIPNVEIRPDKSTTVELEKQGQEIFIQIVTGK